MNSERILEILYRYTPMLLEGLENTIILTLASFAIGFTLGLLIASGRVYGPRLLRSALTVYVEVVRGTPMLLQLFLIYYALPGVGVVLNPVEAAIIGMGLNSAAYQSEYIRSSIKAVPAGQWEAALSLGMTRWQVITSIILPLALRSSIPPLTNELVYLLQYSSIAYFLTVVELVYAGKIIGAETFAYLEVYTIIAVIYLALSLIITRSMRYLEKKASVPGLLTPLASAPT
ncbi:MAG: amino acid ABC transporter permease [Desulfurococcus sp.]|nr:amino acid ABC transporter permease [Desulfurococcus sp.]